MTETNAYGPQNSGDDYESHPTSTRPGHADPPARRARRRTLRSLPTGERGEIWFKGPHLIRGYWNRPEATAETIVDGWLRTGDLGRLDDEGFLYVEDRAKDMILRGGENVYCAEVEAACTSTRACTRPRCSACPTSGSARRSPWRCGRRSGMTVEPDELRATVAAKLAAYKVPVPGARRHRAPAPQRGRQGAQARAARPGRLGGLRSRAHLSRRTGTSGGAASGRRRTRTAGPRRVGCAAGAAALTSGSISSITSALTASAMVRCGRDLVEPAAVGRRLRPLGDDGRGQLPERIGRLRVEVDRLGEAGGAAELEVDRCGSRAQGPEPLEHRVVEAGLREEGVQQRDVGGHALRGR